MFDSQVCKDGYHCIVYLFALSTTMTNKNTSNFSHVLCRLVRYQTVPWFSHRHVYARCSPPFSASSLFLQGEIDDYLVHLNSVILLQQTRTTLTLFFLTSGKHFIVMSIITFSDCGNLQPESSIFGILLNFSSFCCKDFLKSNCSFSNIDCILCVQKLRCL